MLLPSALSCDSSSHPKTRYQTSHSLFASPPLSPQTTTTSTTITNIYSTCRALQSMLTTPNQLPSPPLAHSEAPFKLRLRARKVDPASSTTLTPRKKITKRPAQAPRGLNKRCRATDDEMDRSNCDGLDGEDSCDSDQDDDEENSRSSRDMNMNAQQQRQPGPSTPKRQRIAPEVLPLGLERSDYHSLHLQQIGDLPQRQQWQQHQPISMAQYPVLSGLLDPGPLHVDPADSTAQEQEWTNEDDRLLVELVLEKLKLSKSEWQDCARSLGKDRGSVGKRWKSLMGAGEVGLKGRLRRGRIHGTWR